MTRPRKYRNLTHCPSVAGFSPYGCKDGADDKDAVFLLCEEYETLRLSDYEKHGQCEAAAMMHVSRPTFTRMYISAREKIATAFIEGRPIIIEDVEIEVEDIPASGQISVIRPCGRGTCPKGKDHIPGNMGACKRGGRHTNFKNIHYGDENSGPDQG